MMKRPSSPVDRLRRRIAERLDEDRDKPMAFRRTQTELAQRLGVTKSTLSEMIGGKSATQGALARLDEIADYLDMSPADLVKGDTSNLMELAVDEQRLIRQWRNWPKAIRAQFAALLNYFSELLPEEVEERNYAMFMRQIKNPEVRAHLIGLARDAAIAQRRGKRPIESSSGAGDRIAESHERAEISREIE